MGKHLKERSGYLQAANTEVIVNQPSHVICIEKTEAKETKSAFNVIFKSKDCKVPSVDYRGVALHMGNAAWHACFRWVVGVLF